jgi:hypothetical protein
MGRWPWDPGWIRRSVQSSDEKSRFVSGFSLNHIFQRRLATAPAGLVLESGRSARKMDQTVISASHRPAVSEPWVWQRPDSTGRIRRYWPPPP